MEAYVLVRLHGGEEELIEFLEKIPEVKEAKIVYGEYDVIAHVITKDMRTLSHLVLDEIRHRFDIDRTSTLIVVES
jgi:DNA-binding Lrp family transcriptional regulator